MKTTLVGFNFLLHANTITSNTGPARTSENESQLPVSPVTYTQPMDGQCGSDIPSLGDMHWQLQAGEAFTDATNAQEGRKRKILMGMAHFGHCTRDGAEGCQGSSLRQPQHYSPFLSNKL